MGIPVNELRLSQTGLSLYSGGMITKALYSNKHTPWPDIDVKDSLVGAFLSSSIWWQNNYP